MSKTDKTPFSPKRAIQTSRRKYSGLFYPLTTVSGYQTVSIRCTIRERIFWTPFEKVSLSLPACRGEFVFLSTKLKSSRTWRRLVYTRKKADCRDLIDSKSATVFRRLLLCSIYRLSSITSICSFWSESDKAISLMAVLMGFYSVFGSSFGAS